VRIFLCEGFSVSYALDRAEGAVSLVSQTA